MVRIRLRRVGAKKQPSYRVVVADGRAPRDGRFIETIGHYNPRTDPPTVTIHEDRALYWLSVGAQPSEAVARFFEKLGLAPKLKAVHAGAPIDDVAAPRAPGARAKKGQAAAPAPVPAPKAVAPEVEPKAPEPELKVPEAKTHEPKAAEPKVHEPKAAEPKAHEPKAPEPMAPEPKVAEPKAHEPKAPEPKAHEPKAHGPKAAEAAAPEPPTTEAVATAEVEIAPEVPVAAAAEAVAQPATAVVAAVDVPVDALGLSARVAKALEGAGLTSASLIVAKLAEGEAAVLDLPGIGPKALDEIRSRLAEHGWPTN